MGELVFLCPKTAREIATGISTGRRSLAGRRTLYLDCPHCQELHSFKIAHGWIDNYARAAESQLVPPTAA